jgi:uncharacterized membrane protein YbhN (UPF0104 family)
MSVSTASTAAEATSAGARPSARETTSSSSHQRRLRSGLVSVVALSVLLGGLVLAVPGLGGHRVAHVRWGWVVLAGALEVGSFLGYVLAFQGVFSDVPARFAALVAAAEQAFGAVVPVGGAGGIAAGGWLLSRAGMPVRVIAERSAVLFLLTSATNVVTLVLAGAGLAIGLFAGPHNLVLSAVPAGVGVAVLAVFLALALGASDRVRHGGSLASRARGATAGASAITLRAIRRPGWRLAIGALAFLLCDIAVLWLAIHAVGYDVPGTALVLAYLIGYLANAIPIPGGVGVLDGGLAAALVLYHVPATAAVSGVLVYHALALWIPALSGTVGFIGAQRQITSGSARGPWASPGWSHPLPLDNRGEQRTLRAARATVILSGSANV